LILLKKKVLRQGLRRGWENSGTPFGLLTGGGLEKKIWHLGEEGRLGNLKRQKGGIVRASAMLRGKKTFRPKKWGISG